MAFKDGDASGNQLVQIGGVGNNLVAYAGGNERLRINSQGEVLVGVSTRAISVPGYTTPRIVQAEIKGPIDTSSGKHYGSLALNCTDENAALHLIRSQANNSADLDAGLIGFTVFDGTDYHQCARIQASRDAAGGDNDTPGRLTFFTTADGESSATERLRITSTGKVCINNDTALSDLHVCTAGSSEQDGTLRIGGTNAELGLVLDYDQAGNTVSRIMAKPTYNNASSKFKISADGDTNPDQIVLEGSGRTGFGTDDPSKQIHIEAAIPFLRLEDNTASSKRLDIWVESSNGYIGCNQSSQELNLQTVGTTALSIDANQSVNCKRKFLVSGNASAGTSGYIVMQGYDTSIASGSTKTFTFSGMATGWAEIDIGGYAASGQAATHYSAKFGGYMTQTYTWNVAVLANWNRTTSITATQNASSYTVELTNNASSQTQYFHIATRSSVSGFTCAIS